jgi:hypothetical protein
MGRIADGLLHGNGANKRNVYVMPIRPFSLAFVLSLSAREKWRTSEESALMDKKH